MHTPLLATDHQANLLCTFNPETLPHGAGMPQPPFEGRNWGYLGEGDGDTRGWEALILATHHDSMRHGFKTNLASPPVVRLNRRARRAVRKLTRMRGAARGVMLRTGAVPATPSVRQGSSPSRATMPGSGASRVGLPQEPTFNLRPSTLTFGPPTDIAMGWDGTLWAIDASGAPHLFDPILQQWQPFGTGIDAVAYIGSDIYHFRGSEYVKVTFGANQTQGPPVSIGTTWSKLPYSFKLGVTGAANVKGQLYLFKGGWYAPADTGAVAKLTALKNWPAAWADGVIDAAGTDADGLVRLYRGSEFIIVNLEIQQVAGRPSPMGDDPDWKPHMPAEWAASGIDALIGYGGNHYTVYKGPAFVTFSAGGAGSPAQPQYLPATYTNWPTTWNPLLVHAPGGRMGNLHSVAKSASGASSGTTIQHDGEHWNDAALPNTAQAIAVSVGQDGTTYVATTTGLLLRDSQGWTSVTTTPSGPLADVAVGDRQHIWVRSGDQVQRYGGGPNGTFTVHDLGVPVADMAANVDGTLWHASQNSAYRYISESVDPNAPPALVGKQLCFGAHNGMVYMLDTDEALQSATNGKQPTPVWTYQTPIGTKATSVQTPLLANGQVYVVTWQNNSTSTGEQYDEIVTQLDARTGTKAYDIGLPASDNLIFVPIAPVLGQAVFSGETTPALFVNSYSSIWAVSLTTPTVNRYAVKAPQYGDTNYFSSPMTLSDQGALFVGDFEGNLYALGPSLTSLYKTPYPIDKGNGIFTKPIIVTDDQGNGTAVVGSLGGEGVRPPRRLEKPHPPDGCHRHLHIPAQQPGDLCPPTAGQAPRYFTRLDAARVLRPRLHGHPLVQQRGW